MWGIGYKVEAGKIREGMVWHAIKGDRGIERTLKGSLNELMRGLNVKTIKAKKNQSKQKLD